MTAIPNFSTRPTGNRRLRAGAVLLGEWSAIYLMHQWSGGVWLAGGLTLAMLAHIVRLWTRTQPIPPQPISLTEGLPTVSVLVPCRNEALVVRELVANLYQLDYPQERLEVWIADDRSTDGTGAILSELQAHYPSLKVYSRPTTARAGKSAVLNELFQRATGEMIVVFDADGQVESDFLRRTLAYFKDPQVGALQVRRVIQNAPTNFLTRGQQVEMALDAYYQAQRVQAGGTGELRGNGQVLRRSALLSCGGWNEETITDDLDLTLRLHLTGWDIAFAAEAPVYEEGVTTFSALWRQRQRWAEGGFQRYLDYGGLLRANRLGTAKTRDQAVFFTSQYLLPMGMIPDLYLSLSLGTPLMLGLLLHATTLTSLWGMAQGQTRYDKKSPAQALGAVALGTVYFLHWVPVMLVTLTRIALFPKRLVWVKTARQAKA
ncbi:glycosyltransferase [Anthocerotibacter panamensis]|uniref:glycosyltransferase n=1 Tax=Anthocerotibacter panamensis TaxID=2857077 RepID=UPI001C401D46|nr:glycosyltransferase family 2 protein [Anthocerotibacter panamensis]